MNEPKDIPSAGHAAAIRYLATRTGAHHSDEHLIDLDSDWNVRKPGPYDLDGPYDLWCALDLLLAPDHVIKPDEFVDIIHHIEAGQHRWRNAILRDGCTEEATTLVATRGVQRMNEFTVQNRPVIGRLPDEAARRAANAMVTQISVCGELRIRADETQVSVTILRPSQEDINSPPELHWWASDDEDDTFGKSHFAADDSGTNALNATIPLAATITLFCAIQSQ